MDDNFRPGWGAGFTAYGGPRETTPRSEEPFTYLSPYAQQGATGPAITTPPGLSWLAAVLGAERGSPATPAAQPGPATPQYAPNALVDLFAQRGAQMQPGVSDLLNMYMQGR